MASIFKTQSGKWAYRIDIGIDPVSGKRKQKYAGGFDTQKKAQLAAAQVHLDVAGNSYVPDNILTFDKFAAEWADIYAENVKPTSLKARLNQVKVLNKSLGKLCIQDITRRHYQNLMTKLSKEGFADNTLIGIHATARMIFKKALEFNVITDNPTDFIKSPKRNVTVEDILNTDKKYLEKNELIHFLDVIKKKDDYQYYELFLVLAYTGLRIGEACALTWNDIDFVNKTISVTKTIYNDNNSRDFKFGSPKTKKSIRTIAVSDTVLSVLNDFQKRQRIYRMKRADSYYTENAMVFTSKIYPGYPMNRTHAEWKIKRYLKLAELPETLSPHSLRHTHVSLLAEAGVELHEIMDRLGHLNDNTTRNIYLHVTKEKRRDASDKFDELIRLASSK